jgi:hypothetical protein
MSGEMKSPSQSSWPISVATIGTSALKATGARFQHASSAHGLKL